MQFNRSEAARRTQVVNGVSGDAHARAWLVRPHRVVAAADEVATTGLGARRTERVVGSHIASALKCTDLACVQQRWTVSAPIHAAPIGLPVARREKVGEKKPRTDRDGVGAPRNAASCSWMGVQRGCANDRP